MIVLSVVIVLGICFFAPLLYLAAPGPGWETYVKAALYVVFAVLPVIQYAWTFFYLRLEEIDLPVIEVPANYAAVEPGPRVVRGPWGSAAEVVRPELKLVEPQSRPGDTTDPLA